MVDRHWWNRPLADLGETALNQHVTCPNELSDLNNSEMNHTRVAPDGAAPPAAQAREP